MSEVLEEPAFLTPEKFFLTVESLVWAEDITYIEATIIICDKFMIDIEDVYKLKLICESLKDRIRIDATADGYLKKAPMLPI